jgi:NAD(P)-dependent dehydrogenase (short-subunit alcohol dehydrogenase family)
MDNLSRDPFRLDRKAVLVTGAARGIGRAVALAVAAAGGLVYAVDVRGSELDETRSILGPGHFIEVFDVTETGRLAWLCSEVEARLGSLDALAHVAGVIRRRDDIFEVTEQEFDEQVAVNLKATFFLDLETARVMRQSGRPGSIVNFSSQGWWTGGFGGSTVYSATKGGVVSLTRGLARTFGKDRVRVNAVAPGAVDTAMMHEGLSDDARSSFIAQVPLGRIAETDEIARVVVFLISDASSYMTGATLNVSGGQLAY